MNLQECVEIINDRINDSIDEFYELVALELAKAILYADKYEHYFPDDMIFDYSGEVKIIEGGFDLNDYNTVGDFLEELTGEKEASFCSGYGWTYTTYQHDIERLAMEFIGKVADSTCSDIAKNYKEFAMSITDCQDDAKLAEELCQYIYEDHDCYDAMTQDYELLQQIEDLPFKEFYEKGETQAKRYMQEKMQRENERAEKIKSYQTKSKLIYSKLSELFKTKYGKDLNRIIDKKAYKEIEPLLKDNFTNEEIAIVGRFSFISSNSVKRIFNDFYKLDV